MSRILPAPLIAAVAAAIALVGCEEAQRTRVRVVHAGTSTSAVDVLLDGRLAVSGLAAGHTTDWIDAAPGSTVEVTVGGVSTAVSIDEDGDHVAALSDGLASLAIGRLSPPARRGFEVVLLGLDGLPTTRITVPGRPGLTAQARPGLATSLVLPLDVDRFHFEGSRWSRDVLLDDRLRAQGRVVLVPVGNEDAVPTSFDAAGLLVVDPDSGDVWTLPPAPRVRGLVALTGGPAAMLVGDIEVPALCRAGSSCVLAGIETGTDATISLVVPGSGTVIDRLELEGLRPGEEHIVLAIGDARGPVEWIHVPFRLAATDPAHGLEIVHAAPRLAPLTVFQVGTGARLGTIGPGEWLDAPVSVPVVLSSDSGELAPLQLSIGDAVAIAIVTGGADRLADSDIVTLLPSVGWIVQHVGIGPR